MEKRPYSLPRDAIETKRLDIQADIYDQNIGYLIHPTIAQSVPQNAAVADVACGTGTWTLKVASNPYQCCGLDMSSGQFPKLPPANCTFGTLNILNEIPQEMQNRFDVVHMRLLVVGLTGDDWHTAAANALKMLKPGGWLQWCESNFETLNALQAESGASTRSMRALFHTLMSEARNHGKFSGDVERLFETVQAAGCQQCSEDIVSSDRVSSTRAEVTPVQHQAMAKVIKTMADQRNADSEWMSKIERLIEQCEAEIAGGKAYWRWDIHTVIGQKPRS